MAKQSPAGRYVGKLWIVPWHPEVIDPPLFLILERTWRALRPLSCDVPTCRRTIEVGELFTRGAWNYPHCSDHDLAVCLGPEQEPDKVAHIEAPVSEQWHFLWDRYLPFLPFTVVDSRIHQIAV